MKIGRKKEPRDPQHTVNVFESEFAEIFSWRQPFLVRAVHPEHKAFRLKDVVVIRELADKGLTGQTATRRVESLQHLGDVVVLGFQVPKP